MRILDLALKDLSQLVRDWKTAAFLVLMPMGFTLLFALVFGGIGSGEEDPRLPVGYLDQDGSVVSAHFLQVLEGSDAIRLVVLEEESVEALKEQVGDGDLAAAIIVPAGYGQQLSADAASVRPTLIVDGNSTAGATAQSGIQAGTARLLGGVQAARLAAQAYEAQGGSADAAFLEETLARAIEAWEDPPLTVTASQSGAADEEEEASGWDEGGYGHSSAGIMVQFAMAGLIGAAEILVLERKTGALRRLLTTPISRFEIILGHYLAMFVLILVQLLILVAFGQIALGVDYMRVPLATGLMVVLTALWSASLGLLIGTFAKTEEQVAIFAIFAMLLLAALGGAWFPLEFSSQTFQTIGHLTPTAWAIDGFENIIIRGLGFNSVLKPAAVLLGFTVVFFGLAVWRFKFE